YSTAPFALSHPPSPQYCTKRYRPDCKRGSEAMHVAQLHRDLVPTASRLVHTPHFVRRKSDSHRVGRSRQPRTGGSVAHVRVIHGCDTIAAEQEVLCAYASSARF